MPPLHQDLNTANGRKFVEFLINLFERKHVVVLILLCSIERAEFAVNIANVRVIDVAIDNVGDDLASTSGVTFRLCQIAPRIGQRSHLFERPAIQFEPLVHRNSFTCQHLPG
jgi:hypothetical protein